MSAPLARFPAQVAKLIPRLASGYDAEVIVTARAIGRTLQNAGHDFHTLAAVVERGPECERERDAPRNVSQWAAAANWCAQHDRGRLKQRERVFVHDLAHAWHGSPTERQVAWLGSIYSVIARKDGERVRLWARTTSDYSNAFTRIRDAVAALPVDSAVLDALSATTIET
jgi:hypothetical protein